MFTFDLCSLVSSYFVVLLRCCTFPFSSNIIPFLDDCYPRCTGPFLSRACLFLLSLSLSIRVLFCLSSEFLSSSVVCYRRYTVSFWRLRFFLRILFLIANLYCSCLCVLIIIIFHMSFSLLFPLLSKICWSVLLSISFKVYCIVFVFVAVICYRRCKVLFCRMRFFSRFRSLGWISCVLLKRTKCGLHVLCWHIVIRLLFSGVGEWYGFSWHIKTKTVIACQFIKGVSSEKNSV